MSIAIWVLLWESVEAPFECVKKFVCMRLIHLFHNVNCYFYLLVIIFFCWYLQGVVTRWALNNIRIYPIYCANNLQQQDLVIGRLSCYSTAEKSGQCTKLCDLPKSGNMVTELHNLCTNLRSGCGSENIVWSGHQYLCSECSRLITVSKG